MKRRQNADRINSFDTEMGAKSTHSRSQSTFIVPSETNASGGSSCRQAQPPNLSRKCARSWIAPKPVQTRAFAYAPFGIAEKHEVAAHFSATGLPRESDQLSAFH